MKDAKGLIKDVPDDEDDLADLMEVVKGYAVVDPETAFRLAEPTMDLLNDMVQSLLPSIYPILKSSFHLDFAHLGLLTLTYQVDATGRGVVTDQTTGNQYGFLYVVSPNKFALVPTGNNPALNIFITGQPD